MEAQCLLSQTDSLWTWTLIRTNIRVFRSLWFKVAITHQLMALEMDNITTLNKPKPTSQWAVCTNSKSLDSLSKMEVTPEQWQTQWMYLLLSKSRTCLAWQTHLKVVKASTPYWPISSRKSSNRCNSSRLWLVNSRYMDNQAKLQDSETMFILQRVNVQVQTRE